jgi:hypothetical protein
VARRASGSPSGRGGLLGDLPDGQVRCALGHAMQDGRLT